MTTVLVTGHSHLSCMLKAYRASPDAFLQDNGVDVIDFMWLQAKAFQPNFEELDGAGNTKSAPTSSAGILFERVRRRIARQRNGASKKGDFKQMQAAEGTRQITTDLMERFGRRLRSVKPDWVVGTFMGNEYNALAMPQHPQPFDFQWPEMDFEVRDDAQVLPHEFVKAQLKDLADANALLFLRAFRDVYDGPMALIPPAPPIEDEDHIIKHPGHFRKRIEKFGVSPAHLRLKIYMLYVLVLAEEAAKLNVQMLELPIEAFENGFMKAAFAQSDPTHGNQDYGDLILRHTLKTLTKGGQVLPE